MNNVKGSGGNAGAFCAPTYSCLIENNQPKALSSNLRERLARMIDEKTRNDDGFVSVISWIVLPTTSSRDLLRLGKEGQLRYRRTDGCLCDA